MSKNTSILLGDYFNTFIEEQVSSGKYNSASEVVRTALRLFDQQESKKNLLLNELKKGEDSGFVKNFNRNNFLNDLNNKHLKK